MIGKQDQQAAGVRLAAEVCWDTRAYEHKSVAHSLSNLRSADPGLAHAYLVEASTSNSRVLPLWAIKISISVICTDAKGSNVQHCFGPDSRMVELKDQPQSERPAAATVGSLNGV